MTTVLWFLDPHQDGGQIARLDVGIELLALDWIKVIMTLIPKDQIESLTKSSWDLPGQAR